MAACRCPLRGDASACLAQHNYIVQTPSRPNDGLEACPEQLNLGKGHGRRGSRVLSSVLAMNAGYEVEALFVEVRDNDEPLILEHPCHFAKYRCWLNKVVQDIHHHDAAEVTVGMREMRGVAVNEADTASNPGFSAEKSGEFLLFGVQIHRDNLQPRPCQLDGEKPLARAHIECRAAEGAPGRDDKARGANPVMAATLVEQIPRVEGLHTLISIQLGPPFNSAGRPWPAPTSSFARVWPGDDSTAAIEWTDWLSGAVPSGRRSGRHRWQSRSSRNRFSSGE